MDKKSFKKYFEQTKKMLFTGIGIIAAGIILYLVNYFALHEWMFYQASWLIMVAGVVCIICHFAIRVRDGAVDEYALTFHKELEQQLDDFVTETEKHKRINRVFDYVSGGYELWDKDITKLVFGGDNTPRCEQYGGAALTYTSDTLYVTAGNLNLINGDVNITKFHTPLSEITDIRSVDKSYTKEVKGKSRYVECFVMEINTDNAKIVFTVHPDAMTDDAVLKIKRTAETKKG